MIILGSTSPRRKEIIDYFSLPYIVISPDFDEDSIFFSGDPKQYVCEIAKGKGNSIIANHPNHPILTADSIVYQSGKVFGKPRDVQHAFSMLETLSGKWHIVYTGLSLYYDDKFYTIAEATQVQFNSLSSDHITNYLAKVSWQDKAGAYGIQMGSGLMINQIKGCYYNVMGLPINTLQDLLKKIGIDLWDYIK